MEQQPTPSQAPRRGPVLWAAVLGAWLALFVLSGAVAVDGAGQSAPWLAWGGAPIGLGAFLIVLFSEEREQSRWHWSTVVALGLMLAGFGMMAANVLARPETIVSTVLVLSVGIIVPLAQMLGIVGPRAGLRICGLVAVGSFLAVLLGAQLFFGARLQSAHAQLNVLMMLCAIVLLLLVEGGLRLMDWMIARSERRGER